MLMENFRPKSLSARNSRRWAELSAMALLALAASTSYAQTGLPELQTDMPITIDADSSEFDYATSKLVFHGLRMNQGTLGIQADIAETDKLDFTNGLWIFTGNVIIEAENAKLFCDEAKLTFVNHQLITAELDGAPARFEQFNEASRQTNIGEANKILYKLDAGTLEFREDARFADGANEISGDLITYDIAAKHLTAGSGSSGPVKILIEPPSQLKGKKPSP
jgi:lipopolysaccharide transport protein LptA